MAYTEMASINKEKHLKSKKKKALILLVSSAFIVFLTLSVLYLLLWNKPEDTEHIIDSGRVVSGVTINGVNVSGMTKEEVTNEVLKLSGESLNRRIVTLDVDGKIFKHTLKEVGIGTDNDSVISKAFYYGRLGTFDERLETASKALSAGVDFTLDTRAAKSEISSALSRLRPQMDIDPVDSSYKFFPCGYAVNNESGDNTNKSELAMISGNELPNPLRYQYWRTKKYVENYIPKDAAISRFQYTAEKDGLAVDTDALADIIVHSIDSNDFSIITVPYKKVEPALKVSDLKHQTQLISSWTSSFASHDSSDRVYNITKLSGIINGVMIKPGETWSINKEAGARTAKGGWREAAGITKGAMIPQPGGGVCQVSSTTYNAALRANLEIVDSCRHSIISNYIPIGLDATISTGYPDLKLRNPYSTSVFIVSYVNIKEKNVTVEIYGQPVSDSQYGEVILDFSSKIIGHTGLPGTEVHHRARSTPDGKPLASGQSKTYIKPRRGTTVQTYIHYLSPGGKELFSKEFYIATYPKVSGEVYIND